MLTVFGAKMSMVTRQRHAGIADRPRRVGSATEALHNLVGGPAHFGRARHNNCSAYPADFKQPLSKLRVFLCSGDIVPDDHDNMSIRTVFLEIGACTRVSAPLARRFAGSAGQPILSQGSPSVASGAGLLKAGQSGAAGLTGTKPALWRGVLAGFSHGNKAGNSGE